MVVITTATGLELASDPTGQKGQSPTGQFTSGATVPLANDP